jgi:hypothetical protein
MNFLISTDLHLSDRPRDAYRFGLFKWIIKQQEKYNIDATFFLGDMTENKDRHSSTLVNKIIDELTGLEPPIYILRGNHDGTSPNSPFFKFLNCIEGLRFIIQPTYNKKLDTVFMPHCASQAIFDSACKEMPHKPNMFLAHNTFDGAVAETGARLTGLQASPIEALKPARVYAGDVHVPQQCGPVAYVGAPYHVRFGDCFTPRVLLIKNNQETDLHFDCPRKLTLSVHDAKDIVNNCELRRGDQVKLIIETPREDATGWQANKNRILAACRDLGLEVFGVELKLNEPTELKHIKPEEYPHKKSPRDILKLYCKAESTPANIRQAGFDLLGDK